MIRPFNTAGLYYVPPDVCQVCGYEHPEGHLHNWGSQYYRERFFDLYGRFPTTADAVAHCTEFMRLQYRAYLQSQDLWTEPLLTQPIAELPSHFARTTFYRITRDE